MSDVPPGEWSALLVGHQWPSAASLATLGEAARRRAAIAVSQTEYAGNLRVIRTVTLANQQGATAEQINAAFESGEQAARNVSDANVTKQNAYGSALRHASELRDALTEIANQGNSEIQAILSSQRTPPDKLSAIVTAVVAAQTHANAKAAECSANLFETIQSVCATGTPTLSARQFASANGVNPGRAFGSPDAEAISSQVEQTLRDHPTAAAVGLVGSPVTRGPATDDPTQVLSHADSPLVSTGSSSTGSPQIGSATASPPVIGAIAEIRQDSPTETTVADRNDSPADAGGRSGAPISIGAEAIVAAASNTFAHPQQDPHQDLKPASTAGSPGIAPPPVAAAAPVVNLSTAAQFPSSLAPSVMNPAAPPPTMAPPRPLITYGADLKQAAVTSSAAPTTIPAAPGSAPVGHAGSAGPSSQPAVVFRRQPSGNALTSARVAGLPERAFAAAPASSAAENRLHRLLAAVARQKPELRWAVGDLINGNTVLVTDLASGWIPPYIDIPVGLHLLRPGLRRNNLEALIGEATRTAAYEPGQPIDPDPEPVPMSVRSRDTPAIDDLGWELSQATKWRDGLPRLAHTMARAVTTRTGYLDTEVQLLREQLRAVTDSVLRRYPGRGDVTEVGNWQLLATIDALVNDETVSANYHFAWFMAQSQQLENHP